MRITTPLVIQNDSSANLTLPPITATGSPSITINGSGAGKTIFTLNAVVSGGMIFTSGIGRFSADNQLGISNGSIIFSSGSTGVLNISSGFTTTRPITLTGTGTFDIDSGQTFTISTVAGISGAGGLKKTGSGKLTLTTTNYYTGDTTVSAGTLQGNASSLPTNINNAATLIFDQTSDATFSKTISGIGDTAGNLTVQGGGVLTLTNDCTQNTVTVASNGRLAVNGDISCTASSAGMTINAGGILQGTGHIDSAVLNYGTCAPGNSIGTLTIDGDYSQQDGSTLEIEFSHTPLHSDKLIVNGTFHMGSNTTLSLLPQVGNYAPLTNYIIIQANDGITNFTNTTISLPTFSYTIRAFPNHMRLTINPVPFSSLVTGDALLVARCLDAASFSEGSDLDTIVLSLQGMQIPEMERTMLQMLPTLFNGLDLDQETILIQMRNTLSREMNLMCNNGCQNLRSWRVWSDLFQNYSYQDNQGTKTGYKSHPIGEVIGVDKQITKNVFIGGSVAYAQDNLAWHQDDGKAFLQGGYGAIYAGGWLIPSFYMQGALVGALNHYTTQRYIRFVSDPFFTFERTAKGSFFGFSLLPHVEGGCSFKRNLWRTRGFVKADYAFIHRTTFQETQASAINLRVQSHNADLLRLEFGAELLRCIPVRTITLSPYLSMGGISENRFLGRIETASLIGLNCPMDPAGLFPNRCLFFLETGILHQSFHDRVFFGTDFRGEWQKEYTSLTWSLQFRANF